MEKGLTLSLSIAKSGDRLSSPQEVKITGGLASVLLQIWGKQQSEKSIQYIADRSSFEINYRVTDADSPKRRRFHDDNHN